MTEREIAEWLLNNMDDLLDKRKSLYRESNHLFPSAMKEIYLQQYQSGVLSLVRDAIGKSTNINPEELLTLVTIKLLRKVSPILLEQP